MKKINLILIIGLLLIILSSSTYSLVDHSYSKAEYTWESPNNMADNSGNGFTMYNKSGIRNVTGYNSLYSKSAIRFFTGTNSYTNFSGRAIPRDGSMSFWIKMTSASGGTAVVNKFIFYGSGSGGVRFYLLGLNSRQLCMEVGAQSCDITTANPLQVDKWYHVALVWKSGVNISMYINGTLNGTASITETINMNGTEVNWGYSGREGRPNMTLDNNYIFFKQLSQYEINNLRLYDQLTSNAVIPSNQSITVLNRWDGSSITGFNSTIKYKFYNNNSWQTINLGTTTTSLNTLIGKNNTGCFKWNGGTSYTRVSCLVNITNYKTGQYFANTTKLFNITNGMTDYLIQNIINVVVLEAESNNTEPNIAFRINGTTKFNTTGNTGTIYPKTGNNYQIRIYNRSNFKDELVVNNSFLTTTALQNYTLYVYTFHHYLTIRARTAIGNTSITTFSVNVTNLNESSQRQFSTTNGKIDIPVIHNTYNVTIFGTIYANYNNSKLFNINGNQSYTFYLYQINTILFNLFNVTNLQKTNRTINIQMVGDTRTYTFSTSNGTKYTGALIPDITYKTTFTSTYFNTQILYISLVGGEHKTVNVYLDSGLVSKSFNVKDASNNLNLQNVIITFYDLVNGTTVSVGQLTTDFFGNGNIYLSSSKTYTFTATKTGYNDFSGTITPTDNTFAFSMSTSNPNEIESIYNSVYMPQPTLNYYPIIGQAFNQYILTSSSGVVNYFGYNYTYDGNYYITNLSTAPEGGILENNFSVNIIHQNNVTVTYFYKLTGFDLYKFNKQYYLGPVPENFTLADGLFNDLEDLSGTTGYLKGIIAYIIIVALIVLLLKLTQNMNIAVIGGLIGFAIAYKYNLLPTKLVLLSACIIGIFWFIEKAWVD